jgi:hypothetical protein
MDAVFGPEKFRNEIIWQRHNARSFANRWPRIHDVLLMYSKGSSFYFRPLLVPGMRSKLPHTLVTGPDGRKYQSYELTGAGLRRGETGTPWRGFDPGAMGRHWANTHATMDAWDKEGLIHWPKAGGFPRRRAKEPFDEAERKVTVGDVWTDIQRINQSAKERLSYPTQKPEALLERIITASSNDGDVVLDPFCGCGTAIAVAQRLNRQWIGIDITHLAVALMKHRLATAYGDGARYKVIGEPTTVEDAEQLARDDPYQFQWWALGLVGARPMEGKKGADKGIDGRLYFHEGVATDTRQVILSVKAGRNVSVAMVRDLGHVVQREQAQIGVLITMTEPTQPMRTEAASAGFYHSDYFGRDYPRLQIRTVAELLAGKGIDYPAIGGGNVTFKSAQRVRKPTGEQLALGDGG